MPTIFIAFELPELPELLTVDCTTGTYSTIDDVYVVTCPFARVDFNDVTVVTSSTIRKQESNWKYTGRRCRCRDCYWCGCYCCNCHGCECHPRSLRDDLRFRWWRIFLRQICTGCRCRIDVVMSTYWVGWWHRNNCGRRMPGHSECQNYENIYAKSDRSRHTSKG